MYESYGVPKDSVEAVKWYRKAAEQGIAEAQFNLGKMYNSGEGVPRDYVEAAKWYRKAAEQGIAEAQCLLGEMYWGVSHNSLDFYKRDGYSTIAYYGVKSDTYSDAVEAVKWYRKAADQGHDVAQRCLGEMYNSGYGVPKDSVEAVKWFRKAADQGNNTAQSKLGEMYNSGEGVPRDPVEAAKWSRKSVEKYMAEAPKRKEGFWERLFGD
jgi:hypothetical protein